MILPSTLRKMRVAGVPVVRVTVPSYVFAGPGGEKVDHPEGREYFSTIAGAENWMRTNDPAQWGVEVVMTVDKISADRLDASTCRE